VEVSIAIAEFRPLGLDSHLRNLVENFEYYGDKINAQILNNLRLKLEQQVVTVACCGYVSAGKSRLLNSIIGEQDLLPISPLPNSKNTVYLRPGKQQQNLGLWYKFKQLRLVLNIIHFVISLYSGSIVYRL